MSSWLADHDLLAAMGFRPLGLAFRCPACDAGGECQALRPPSAGEIVLCFDCGALLAVRSVEGDALALRKAEDDDLQHLDPEELRQLRENAEAIVFLNAL